MRSARMRAGPWRSLRLLASRRKRQYTRSRRPTFHRAATGDRHNVLVEPSLAPWCGRIGTAGAWVPVIRGPFRGSDYCLAIEVRFLSVFACSAQFRRLPPSRENGSVPLLLFEKRMSEVHDG